MREPDFFFFAIMDLDCRLGSTTTLCPGLNEFDRFTDFSVTIDFSRGFRQVPRHLDPSNGVLNLLAYRYRKFPFLKIKRKELKTTHEPLVHVHVVHNCLLLFEFLLSTFVHTFWQVLYICFQLFQIININYCVQYLKEPFDLESSAYFSDYG